MSATACALLRHDVRPRWVGDLLMTYCELCGCLYIPEPASSGLGRIPPATQPGAAHADPATHASASPLAAVTQASPAH